MFFATHSEHVLKEALSDKTKNIVITLKENEGVVESRKIDTPFILPSITNAETTYLAFDVISNDFHTQLYGLLQERESKPKVKSCDDFITNHSSYNSSTHRKRSCHGATDYESLCTYIRNAIHHPDPEKVFTDEELRSSIELLIQLCR